MTVFANGAPSNFATGAPFSTSGIIGTGYNGNNRPLTTGVGCNQGQKENQILNPAAFTLVGYPIGTIPKNIESRGYCFGAPTTDWDFQLAKNWYVKERLRIKFAMDFFDILNRTNFNTAGLEGTGYSPANVSCGSLATPCSPTNNVITSQSAVTGFGSTQVLQNGRSNREMQYSLKFSF